MNQDFMDAMAPYRDHIEAYFSTANGGSPERFQLWKSVMGTLTSSTLNPVREEIIREYAASGKKIVVVIPERAHPRLYLSWLLHFAETILDAGGDLINTHLIFSGGVVGQDGTDGKFYSFEEMYGEFTGSAMDAYLRRTHNFSQKGMGTYQGLFSSDRVTCDNLSKNTGDQACILANLILGSNSDLVVFLGPQEHVARFALTVHCGIRTYAKVFRANYLARLEKMRILVVPAFREGGWQAMTDLDGVTAAMDAFGPLDDNEERLRLFPKKRRGQELVERIGEEMYGPNALNFIMNVTTLEDAIDDQLFHLELSQFQT